MKKIILTPILLLVLTACQSVNQPSTPPPTEQQEATQHQANTEDKIKVDAPLANAKVESPLTVSGQARGTWFFEGSFPVTLVDSQGKTLAQVPATSAQDWMTEEFIPFEAILEFETDAKQGELILQKDNPSGLSELDEELRIPVQF